MDNYTEQAQNFLSATQTTLEIIYLGQEQNKLWNDTYFRNHYLFVMRNSYGYLADEFWDSVHNTVNNIKPTAYDILSSLEVYAEESFEDFCYEYSYDTDSMRAYNIYEACLGQSAALHKMFKDAELEALAEIR